MKHPKGRSADDKLTALQQARMLLAQRQLECAETRLDDDEEFEQTGGRNNLIVKTAIAAGLIIWIITMVWFGWRSIKRREAASAGTNRPTYLSSLNPPASPANSLRSLATART